MTREEIISEARDLASNAVYCLSNGPDADDLQVAYGDLREATRLLHSLYTPESADHGPDRLEDGWGVS